MKLYYITNTLNIDNILSSESISPIAVYSQRGFGYNTFEPAPFGGKMDLSNSIILFAEIPFYKVDANELECAPMVIEIDDDCLDSMVKDISLEKNGSVFEVKESRSIVLTPSNCHILFTDWRGYNMARLKCQDSKCNKWWEYFKTEIVDVRKNAPLDAILQGIKLDTASSPNIEKEILSNRKKGLLWGYALGYAKSVPGDIAKLRAIQKQIYNTVASIINSGGRASQAFIENIKKWEKEYRELDPVRKALVEAWNDELERLLFTHEQKEFLSSLDKTGYLLLAYAKLHNFKVRQNVFNGGTMNFSWAQYQESLATHTQAIINDALAKRADSIQLNQIFVDTSDNGLTVFGNSENDDIFAKIIQSILLTTENPLTIEEIRIDKISVIKRFHAIYKERGGEEYKQSKTYEYLSGIVRCINEGESFDPLSSSDPLLQNIAAFILKGDSYEEMSTYIVEKGIASSEYAMAMLCACTGYVDLSRSIILSLSQKESILSNVYQQVLSLAYGINKEIKLEKQPQIVSTGGIKLENVSPIEKLHMDERFHQFPAKTQSKIEQAAQVEALVQDKKAFLMILDSFINRDHEIVIALDNKLQDKYSSKAEFRTAIYEICAPYANKLKNKVRNKPYKYGEAIERAIDLEAKIGDPHAFMYILDNTFKPGSKEYETVRAILGLKTDFLNGEQPSVMSQIKGLIGDLFSSQESREPKQEEKVNSRPSLLEDFGWVSECEGIISTRSGKEQFRQAAQIVVVDHLSGKSKAEKENADVISHLRNLLMKMAKEGKRDYSLAEIKDIENHLKQKYGIR